MKRNSKKKILGFTLIELLVAATIASVLAAAGMVSFVTVNRNARNAKRKADLEQVRAALELYRSDNQGYPNSNTWDAMMTLIGGYLSNQSRIGDPKNIAPYVYTYTLITPTTYTVCADIEPNATAYCVNNP
jgi:general secretion pathway protein G